MLMINQFNIMNDFELHDYISLAALVSRVTFN